MFRVACYDTDPHGKRKLILSSKSFAKLLDARAYARTISPSRKPVVLHELPLEPESCPCGGDSSDPSGWYTPCCGAC